MLGRLKDLSMNMDGSQDVRITVYSDLSEMFSELQNREVDVEIKKHSKKRSLDINNLCWLMIDKISEKTKIKKSEVYRNAIKDIGGVSDIVCVQDFAVEKLVRGWTSKGLGWQADVEKSKLPGCSNVTLYYGSSVYSNSQMAALVQSLMQDAEALGIPTPSQAEQDAAMAVWNRKQAEKTDEGR